MKSSYFESLARKYVGDDKAEVDLAPYGEMVAMRVRRKRKRDVHLMVNSDECLGGLGMKPVSEAWTLVEEVEFRSWPPRTR